MKEVILFLAIKKLSSSKSQTVYFYANVFGQRYIEQFKKYFKITPHKL